MFSRRQWHSPTIAQVAIVLFSLSFLTNAQQPVQVKLDDGMYTGTTTNGVNKFLGIRYATPPVRFAPPIPAAMMPHDDVRNATEFAASCMQAIPGKLPFLTSSYRFPCPCYVLTLW